MIRTQVYLTPGQHRALREEARREGCSMTERLRRILDGHFSARTGLAALEKDGVLAFIDLGSSGHVDTSERVDEVLDEALRDAPLR